VQNCYRHPGQPAGVICQRCDRPICPHCMHTASVGFHCPECVKKGGQKVYRGPGALATRPLLTQILIGVNVAAFVLGAVMGGGGAVRQAQGDLFVNGALYGPLVAEEPWRIVTGGFLHSGFIHLGFNMYALYVLGRILEPAIGRLRFGLVYGASLLAGAFGAVLLAPDAATVGASGAIFGMMGATLVLAKRRNADALVNGLMITLGLNLFITFAIPNISIGGHIGGAIGGAICGLILVEAEDRLPNRNAAAALIAAAGITFAVATYVFMAARFA